MWQKFIIFITLCGKQAAGEDVLIDAKIHMDPNFVKSIKQSIDDQLELFGVTLENEDNEDLSENYKRYMNSDPVKTVMQDNLAVLKIYEKRSLNKGADSIESIASYLAHVLKVKRNDVAPIIHKINSSYYSQIDDYFTKLINVVTGSDIDEEYMILDMVNVVSLITRNIHRQLLDNILTLGISNADKEKDILIGTLLTFNDMDKRQEADFVCEHFEVCRPNPAFSGYVYKLLEELLKVKGDKLRYFVMKCANMLMQAQSIFETLLGKNVSIWVKSKIENITGTNVTEIKQAVRSLHSIILHRYNIESTNSIETKLRTRTRAKAILADILDIAYGLDGDDIYGARINDLITVIKDWRSDIVVNIEEKIEHTIKYIIKALEKNLTKRGKKEIMTLVNIIFYNRSTDQIAKEDLYLMTEGSKFGIEMVHNKKFNKN